MDNENTKNYYELLKNLLPKSEFKLDYDLPNYRTIFMRDRDRILYNKAFLRLSGKTQIYSADYDDHARNRLTHSLEVSQIARTIATSLNLDINLTEAIALGHDIGHTPFGHAGERELNTILQFNNDKINTKLFGDFNKEPSTGQILAFLNDNPTYKAIMESNWGFKHNWQGVRVITNLSREYPDGNMALTTLTLSGILHHCGLKNKDDSPLNFYNTINENCKTIWSLEGLVVAVADEIAQRHHDIEDAITCHYLTPKSARENILDNTPDDEEIKNLVEAFGESIKDLTLKSITPLKIIASNINKNYSELTDELISLSENHDLFLRELSRKIVNWLVTDIYNNNIGSVVLFKQQLQSMSIEDAKKLYLSFSNETKIADKLLQLRLKKVILNSRSVQRMDSRGSFIIRKLFRAYVTAPKQMPDKTLNSVFREYLRQIIINNNNMEVIKSDDIEKALNSEFTLFKTISECRAHFDYFYDLTNDSKYKNLDIHNIKVGIPINTFLFRICLMRIIADYISGMTDSYAEKEYRKLYGIIHDIDA